MKRYPAGVAVTVTIPFVDLNGDPVEPSAVTMRVYDQDGVEVVASTSLVVTAGALEQVCEIAGSANMLAAGLTSGVRTVELTMVTAAGQQFATQSYVIVARAQIVIPQSGFQSYEMALVNSNTMPPLLGWASADETARIAALHEAFSRLTRIGYRVRRAEDIDTMNYLTDTEEFIQPRAWPVFTLERWQALAPHFKQALQKAQLAEANEILRGDPVVNRRREGVLSESIGESSMMFRTGKPLDLGISAAAMHYLTGYIEMRITLTRS